MRAWMWRKENPTAGANLQALEERAKQAADQVKGAGKV